MKEYLLIIIYNAFFTFRYGRKSVRDEIYLAASDLIGIGLSPSESLAAIEVVANRCFGRKWHRSKELSKQPLNQDTLPSERSVRKMSERIETQGLAAEAEEIQTRSKAGDVITHCMDSTTKKYVSKFAVSGIHINKENPLPLPTVPVAGES